jgi:omega-amidase
MQDLKIALVQCELAWENIDENIRHIGTYLDTLEVAIDLVLLPEMFTTGFSMNAASLALESMDKGLSFLKQRAKEHFCVIAGSLIVEENGSFFNRLYYYYPDGRFEYYDKKHLFSLADEHLVFTAGTERVYPVIKGWKLLPLICYDLRFPEWCRNDEGYDLLVFHANWPEKRAMHWNALLEARSIENVSYVAAVNRVGEDGKNLYYNGDSQFISPGAHYTQKLSDGKEGILYATCSYDELKRIREMYPFLKDMDL